MSDLIALQEIINFLGNDIVQVFGNIKDVYIKHLKPPEYVDDKTLDWIAIHKNTKQVIAEQSKAPAIICDDSVIFSENIKVKNKVLIHVKNPRMAIALIANHFFLQKPLPGIHQSAFIDPEAVISSSAYIGPGCVIGKCLIGDNSIINPNVTIYDKVKIGSNVLIQAGAVIGTDGLGCEREPDGTLIKFSHLGGVIIGNNVEIGANCQIAKGVFSDTIIGDGTKINGLCFIAHNCNIGKNVWITGGSMLSGSVIVKDNATIYSKVIIREQRIIGKGATLGMGSVITKDVPPGETWIGNPAKKIIK